VGVGRSDELAEFGWWFSSKRFNNEWSLAQLHKVLEAKVLPVAGHDVAEQVASLCPQHLSKALSILDLLLDANTQVWGLYGWRGPAKSIVAMGINSSDSDDRRLATEIASRFCSPSYGYSEFRSLEKTEIDGGSPPGEPPQP
jgi:hypothetical protein